jgi:hypothetical protein
MKNIRHELGVWCQAIAFISIWVLLIYVTEPELKITAGALKEIPDVVLVYTLVYLLFTRWGWRWKAFQPWLVPIPWLQGTWRGRIVSTWTDPTTGAVPPPVDAFLVIRHTFDGVSCTLLTAESESSSSAAALTIDEASDRKTLSYNYLNEPRVTVRGRSERHTGAAVLKLATESPLCLTGEYWTSRKTTGEMEFSFESRRLRETFKSNGPGSPVVA